MCIPILFSVTLVGMVREKPTFTSALRISIFDLVRLAFFREVAEVIVLAGLLLPNEKEDNIHVVLDHLPVAAGFLMLRHRSLGSEEGSSGEIGVSSISVIGVVEYPGRLSSKFGEARLRFVGEESSLPANFQPLTIMPPSSKATH
jgi:hypothetical protein